MARLEALDRSWLDLSPLEYQFPEIEDDEYDANWLYVEFAASFAEYTVARTATPAFLTWELHSLVADMTRLSAGEIPDAELDGIEPNLQLRLSRAGSGFEVAVGAALDFAPESREPFDEPFWANVTVSEAVLSAFARDLAAELESLPVRAIPPTTSSPPL